MPQPRKVMLTVPELKQWFEEQNIAFPSWAKRAALVKLCLQSQTVGRIAGGPTSSRAAQPPSGTRDRSVWVGDIRRKDSHPYRITNARHVLETMTRHCLR